MEHFDQLLIASMAAYEVPGACISRCRSILAAAWKAAGTEARLKMGIRSRIAQDDAVASSGAIGAEKEPDAPGDGLDGFLGPSGAPPPS